MDLSKKKLRNMMWGVYKAYVIVFFIYIERKNEKRYKGAWMVLPDRGLSGLVQRI